VIEECFTYESGRNPTPKLMMDHQHQKQLLEEKPAHHPLEPLDVALKHTGWMPPAYLYSLAESAKVEGKRIVNSDIN
jgi:FtsP/CotA-like multicopper oxidase with cupredoxin domain